MRNVHTHRSHFVGTVLLLVGAIVTTVAPAASAQVDPESRAATGIIVDAAGLPLAGLTVTTCTTVVDRADLGQCPADVSADNGSFTIPDVDGAAVAVTVLTRSTEVLDRRLAPMRFHTIVRDEPTTHRITLHRLLRATGRLIGPHGPLSGASVVHVDRDRPSSQFFTATSGAGGQFEIDIYPTSGWCHLDIDAADHRSPPTSRRCAWGDRVDFGDVRLRLDRTVTITAAGPDGGPLSGFKVSVRDPDGQTYTEATSFPRYGEMALGIGLGDGRPYTMTLIPDDPSLYALPVSVTPSATDKHQVLTIPTLRYAALRAQATTPAGQPARNVSFDLAQLDGEAWIHKATLEVSDGSLNYAQLRPGRYRLTPSALQALPEAPREFTVDGSVDVDLGDVTVRPFAAGYRASLTLAPPRVSPNYAYREGTFPVISTTVTGFLHGVVAAPDGSLRIDLLDGTGRVVSSQALHGSTVSAELPSDQVGTQSGFRFRVRGNGFYAETRSAVAPPHTISRHASRLGTPKLTDRSVPWDERTSVSVPFTGVRRGPFELLVDGAVVARTDYGNSDDRNGNISFLVPKLSTGKHRVQVRRPVSKADAAATSASATLSVTRARAAGRPAITASRFARGTRPTIRVRLPRTAAGTPLTGKMTIYVGSAAVTTVRLSKNSPRTVKIKLPHRATRSIKVRAVYKGSSKFVGVSSRTVTVKVRR